MVLKEGHCYIPKKIGPLVKIATIFFLSQTIVVSKAGAPGIFSPVQSVTLVFFGRFAIGGVTVESVQPRLYLPVFFRSEVGHVHDTSSSESSHQPGAHPPSGGEPRQRTSR